MSKQLTKQDLPQLFTWLGCRLPHSFKMYRAVEVYMGGHYPEMDVFVDKWPTPEAVLSINKGAVKSDLFSSQVAHGVYAENCDALSGLLKDLAATGRLDWSKPVTFCCVSEKLWPAIQHAADGSGLGLNNTVCVMMEATPQTLKRVPVPEGMTVSPVCEDTIGTVHSTWKFSGSNSSSHFRHLVSFLPSLVLKTTSGAHVGHMLGRDTVTMGTLYVLPEFRRKGYAKVIISQLAQKNFDIGKDAVYVFVEEDNQASIDLHQSVGFNIVSDMRVSWMVYQPSKCCKTAMANCCT